MEIKKVAVIGGGLMGRQIALNTAIYSYDVWITDNNPEVLEQVKKWKDEYLDGRIAKGRMTVQKVAEIQKRFYIAPSIDLAVYDADLVIEAVVEQEAVKHALFKQLGNIVRPDTILTTNSSCMVSSIFAHDIPIPARLCNLHYFNPALVMKLTEVVYGKHTSKETAQTVYDFSLSTGKTPIMVEKEIDGFIVNRILGAIYKESRFLVENGYCSYKDLDTACENGLGHPMGPFRLNDLTGIDLTYDIMKSAYEKDGKKPLGFDLIKELFDKGYYGKKSGHGFYDYQ